MKIGAQMFTVRNYTDTLDELVDTLKRIKDIGYSSVQISATCPYEPEWLGEQLKSIGLTCEITHYNFDRIMNDTDNVIKEHKAIGCDAIGIPTIANYDLFDQKGKEVGQKIKDSGLYLSTHNHDKEYLETRGGKSIMKYLSDTFSPDILGFTLDLYWAEAAGESAISEIRRLSGRIPYVHFKDMIIDPSGKKKFSYVGGGIMDYSKIAEECIKAGCKVAYVEQDSCYGENPFDCLKKSYDYLKSIGLE